MRWFTVILAVFVLLLPAVCSGAEPFVLVLGVAQDGGHPQTGCTKSCCAAAQADPAAGHMVACLALVAPESGERWLLDATPDLPRQLALLDRLHPVERDARPRDLGLDGVFLTHAHMGHYTGLMHLGRESVGAPAIPVHAMPRMATYLRENGPWSQLVTLRNIELREMAAGREVVLGSQLRVKPLLVPHRDEFSETVGFVVAGPNASVLFLPDIDKWEQWDRDLAEVLASVDRAYVDGTFFENGEIPGRDMADIPHPFIEETLARVEDLPASERAKLRFIHLNHTNPALDPEGEAVRRIRAAGCGVAAEGERFGL